MLINFLQLEIKMIKLQLIPKIIELNFLKMNGKQALYYNVNLIIVQFSKITFINSTFYINQLEQILF